MRNRERDKENWEKSKEKKGNVDEHEKRIDIIISNLTHHFSFYVPSSDGAGRSGVYLAIDANIELSEEDGVIDVFGYVRKMRTQRRGLVESLVSYVT